MTKLKGLLLTEGMHGMISQVEGLAKALGLDFIHEKIELNNFWKMIPPKITPIKRFVFKNDILEKFNVVISCGRKSVIPSIFLKKKFGNKIMNIHIQDPKVSLNNFDFVIAPEHDDLKGENVLSTKGAIHYLRESELDDNIKYLKSIHIHGNNINKLDKNGYPYAIEITFINVKRIKYEKKSNYKNYPIEGLDFPSVKRNDDIKINFI